MNDALSESLADIVERTRRDKKLPALAVAFWREGREVALHASGTRKLGDPTPVTTEDRWHLGSNTKAMLATLAGVYVDRKRVAWTDTIGTLFRGEKFHAAWKDVTLDQLLRHTAGAPEQPPDDVWMRAGTAGLAPGARARFVRDVLAVAPAKPGTFAYSNAGYVIAGAALERLTKQTWEELMRRDLFEPLGMTSCGFGAPPGESPWGHDDKGTPIAPGLEADNPPAIGPAGTVHCTLRDYGKFLAVHAGVTELVEPATLAHLHAAAPGESYAGGWMLVELPAGTLLAHSGSNTLWYATALVSPVKHTALVLVTNKGDATVEDALLPILGHVAQLR